MSATVKIKRQQRTLATALRQLLLEETIGTHEDICTALQKQGFEVSQPMISRSLHKLGAIKVLNAAKQSVYRLPHEHRLAHELTQTSHKMLEGQFVMSVVASDTLIIVRTSPGAASLVARVLDLEGSSLNILGSIAGDDTVLVVPKSSQMIAEIQQNIKTLLLI
ncbi:transcriptional regulator ArgR [soil metagenome]